MSVKHLFDREDWYVISVDHGEDKGKAPWRARAVIVHGPRTEAKAEWSCLARGFGYGVEFGRNGGEGDVGLSIYAGPLASVWLGLRSPWTSWLRVRPDQPDRYTARQTGLRLFPYEDCYVQVKVEDRDDQWSKGQPWWWSWSLGRQQVFGPTDCTTTVTGTGDTVVPMPEGTYPATWTQEQREWRHRRPIGTWRDRLLGVRTRTNVRLDISGGIPHEGKGENGWDCGMDGLFGCGGATVADAVANAVRSVTRDRERYGGPHGLTEPTTVRQAAAPSTTAGES